ncbi:MAG: hypothetical protein JSS02_30425 [Planctomycetes bacterium]|nr:hypothetical protein [Planctomycetota bacterium]
MLPPSGEIPCPMCGARVSLSARRCPACHEDFRLTSAEIADLKHRLKHWVRFRTTICGAVVFILVFAAARWPTWGTVWTNITFAAIVTVPLAAFVGLLLQARAYLHLQRILAEDAGSTLSFEIGRKLRKLLRPR